MTSIGIEFMLVNERPAPTVDDQPVVQPKSWRVFESATGSRHLVAILKHGPLRVTSRIIDFDNAAAVLTTESGRRYELNGPPEDKTLERALLAANALRCGLAGASDISASLWESVTKQ
jgi:hypothetical protein